MQSQLMSSSDLLGSEPLIGNEEFQTLTGVGVELYKTDETSPLIVRSVHPGSAADVEGIKAGDVVDFLDGLDSSILSVSDAASMLLGPQQTSVTLQVRPQGRDPGRIVNLTRTVEKTNKYDFHRKRRPVPPAQGLSSFPPSLMEKLHADGGTEYTKVRPEVWVCVQDICEGKEISDEVLVRTLGPANDRSLLMWNSVKMVEEVVRELREAREAVDHLRAQQGMRVDQREVAALRAELEELSGMRELYLKTKQELVARSKELEDLRAEEGPPLSKEDRERQGASGGGSMPRKMESPRIGETFTEIARLNHENEKLKESLGDLQAQLDSAHADIEDKDRQLHALTHEVDQNSHFKDATISQGQKICQLQDELEFKNLEIEELKSRQDLMLKELAEIRKIVNHEQTASKDKDELIVTLQEQILSFQTLSLEQSRENDRAMQLVETLRHTEKNQEQEILRLNSVVLELEDRQRIQTKRVEDASERWRIKRDNLASQLMVLKDEIKDKDKMIEKHRALILEYQSVLEVLKKAGGAGVAFKRIEESQV
mmetsp:Transcript_17789/g.40270  ORF Transcript_17789/g.40270 Transcript_17789/m.40270 type:complete len:542 (-) Transcript_17789:22-1647(-)